MKTTKDEIYTEPGSSGTNDGLVSHPALDQEAVAILAHFYWEARGCPNDSSDEDWFRAEADLHNHRAVTATA
jgi:Protein of unknown function (DUF2934)